MVRSKPSGRETGSSPGRRGKGGAGVWHHFLCRANTSFHSNLCISGKAGPASWPRDGMCLGPGHSKFSTPHPVHNNRHRNGTLPSHIRLPQALPELLGEMCSPLDLLHRPGRSDGAEDEFSLRTKSTQPVSKDGKREREKDPTTSAESLDGSVTEARPTLPIFQLREPTNGFLD